MTLSERAKARLEASYRNMKVYKCACSESLTFSTDPDLNEECEECGKKFQVVKSALERAIDTAYNMQKRALAEKTHVGCAFIMRDGKVIGGANIENSYKKAYHAEEVAIIRAIIQGYGKEDFSTLVQVAFAEDKVYPACLSCIAYLWDYTNPNLEILIVHNHEIIRKMTLKSLMVGFTENNVDIYQRGKYHQRKR